MFITFEGIDGSGKSTQAKMLYNKLLSKHIPAVITREPGGCDAAEKIRELILQNISGGNRNADIALIYAARIMHYEQTIKPAIDSGKIVICDRYIDSTITYQALSESSSISTKNHIASTNNTINTGYQQIIYNIHKMLLGHDVMADITFLMDLPVSIACERIRQRNSKIEDSSNHFDHASMEIISARSNAYREIARAEPSRIITIDAGRESEQVHQDIWGVLQGYFI